MGKYDHIKSPKQAWGAVSRLRKIRRIPELEGLLILDPAASYNYAMKIIQGRWIEAEPNILTKGNAKIVFLYARNIVKQRWTEAEQKIIEDGEYIFDYASELIGDRWPEAEEKLLQTGEKEIENKKHFWKFDLMQYCRELVKDRWEEAEAIFAKNPDALLEYSKNVLEDKLPENLHNMMICYSLSDDYDAKRTSKEYLDFVKETESKLKKQIKNRQTSKEMKVAELLEGIN